MASTPMKLYLFIVQWTKPTDDGDTDVSAVRAVAIDNCQSVDSSVTSHCVVTD